MKRQKWLILDGTYLCYRAMYLPTFRALSSGDVRTGLLYSILRDICTFQDLHNTSNIVFCFDRGHDVRTKVYKKYKANRRQNLSEDDKEMLKELSIQMRKLRTDYLPELGFRNIFTQKGYEADDLVASTVNTILDSKDIGIIIGADHDFYQLLHKRILMWNPHTKEAITKESFTRKYGISPSEWATAKAIAGCSSDNVRGVEGVGEITAVRFLRKEINKDSKTYQAIVEADKIIRRNLKLVRLPFKGTREVVLRKDKISNEKWRALTKRLGMRTIESSFRG